MPGGFALGLISVWRDWRVFCVVLTVRLEGWRAGQQADELAEVVLIFHFPLVHEGFSSCFVDGFAIKFGSFRFLFWATHVGGSRRYLRKLEELNTVHFLDSLLSLSSLLLLLMHKSVQVSHDTSLRAPCALFVRCGHRRGNGHSSGICCPNRMKQTRESSSAPFS